MMIIKILSLIFLAVLMAAILLKKNMVAVALVVLYITLLAGYLVHTSGGGDFRDEVQRPSDIAVDAEAEEDDSEDEIVVGPIEGYQDNVWDGANSRVRVPFVPDALMDIQGEAIVQGDDLQGYVL